MQFEGEHKQIVLRGIERNAANGMAQDGGMDDVISLIPRNGSYVPYAPKDVTHAYEEFITSETKMVRVHHTSTGDNTIIVFENYYLVNPEETTVEGETVITGRVDKSVEDIVFVGNRMDLSTEDGIEHWLWKNGEYVNQDDLGIHRNVDSVLPSVSFKVSRGIYDGSKVYKSAKYVKIHKDFTDEDTATPRQEPLSKYVRELGSVGSDAMALLDSIRYMGGITGYMLVAAAWRIKGSDVSNPKYVMASPVLLMGAPEIYMKDGKYESGGSGVYIDKPSESFLQDMFDYDGSYVLPTNPIAQDEVFDKLWELNDSDDRKAEDMTENEHVFIEPIEEGDTDTFVIRRYESGAQIPQGHRQEYGVYYGDNCIFQYTWKSPANLPALSVIKYAMYNHGRRLGTANGDAAYKAIRISRGTGNVLYFKLNENLAEEYKDEVDRLCIFASPVISPYKTNDAAGVRFKSDYVGDRIDKYDGFFFANEPADGDNKIYHSGCSGSFSPIMKSEQEIRNDIKNIAGLYKVTEVQLNELGEGADLEGWVKVNLGGGKLATDKMVQHSDTMLKLSDLQPVGFTKGHIFGYNERLHVFNFRKDQAYRLPYESLLYYGGDGQYQVTNNYANKFFSIEVTDSNNSTIVSRFRSTNNHLNPLIACADVDAKQIRVAMIVSTLAGEFIKAPLAIGGIIGGIMTDDLKPLSISVGSVEDIQHYFKNDDIKPDTYAWGKNEIRVSNTATTIFEPDKSYKVGHGEIIALARLSMGLSQDNYSKYPLVVFCTDGVYTLSVDSTGQYAYHSQDPLSRVVCTNKNGICELDGAVLFPTEYGLQIVTTDGVKPVALAAIGDPKFVAISTSTENGLNPYYHNAVTHPNIVKLLSAMDYADFLSVIQNKYTYIKYLHAINSVIVYNRYNGYSYLIDMSEWSVVKIQFGIAFDNNDYPKQTFWELHPEMEHEASEEVVTRPVQFDYYSGKDNSQTLLVSRPIHINTKHLKTAYRVVLRGAFEYKGDDKKCAGMYVFGSLDGNHWNFLNGTEKLLTNNRFHDLGVETHHVSYKYLLVIVAADLSADSHIDGLELTENVKYNNKLK